MSILKRCPFCKGKAIIIKKYIGHVVDVYYAQCLNCLAMTDIYKGVSYATKAWNKRTSKKLIEG